ncbi:hypothetical protein ABC395_03765 [Paenibacillus sp. 1P03SA]
MAKNRRRLASFLSGMMLCSLLLPAGQGLAAVPGATASAGPIVDKRTVEIGPGATYQWMDMKLDRGPEKLHFVEFDPKNAALESAGGQNRRQGLRHAGRQPDGCRCGPGGQPGYCGR